MFGEKEEKSGIFEGFLFPGIKSGLTYIIIIMVIAVIGLAYISKVVA